jgi:dienelactone hydrolase
MAMTSARDAFTSTIIPGMTAPGKLLVAAMAGLTVALAVVAVPYARTAAFLLDLAGIEDARRAWIPIAPVPVTSRDISVPTRHGAIPVRAYVPTAPAPPAVVVFPGVHGGGVDAPRLTRLCQRLSSSGLLVICAPLPDLREFRITSRTTDVIEDVTGWVAADSTLAPAGRVTLVGVSFAGGLALVAAGRDTLHGRLRAVVSIGGHGDLNRTLDYLVSGTLPDGTSRPPHDYPLAIVALTLARHLVPEVQVAQFEAGVTTFLQASLDESADGAGARPLLASLAADLETMPEPARGLVAAVVRRDVAAIGNAVAPYVHDFGHNPALSPALAPRTLAPVYLLHGNDDNVIPSTETPLLAADLATHGNRHVRWLLTPLVTHAHLVTGASAPDVWRLISFWRDVRQMAQP